MVEKPFGHDLESARELNDALIGVFDESQVYRIDHYLGKETVRNLMVFRFGNGIFEPLWNRRYVDHVQITVAEDVGVEGRGAFYEEAGASRDILQNHLLQLLTLVAMEPPIAFEADALRDEKVRVLRAIDTKWTEARVRATVVRGQYTAGWVGDKHVAGYREEDEVDARFQGRDLRRPEAGGPELALGGRAVLPAHGQAPRSSGDRDRDPVQAAAADALRRQRHRRRSRTCSPCASSPTRASCCASRPRCLSSGLDVRSVNMDFTYGLSFTRDAPEAYETLLLDAMLGDASLFTRADEVEAAWAIVTPIIEHVAGVGQGWHAGQRHLLLRGRQLGARGGRHSDRARRPPLEEALAMADKPAPKEIAATATTPRKPRLATYPSGGTTPMGPLETETSRWHVRARSISRMRRAARPGLDHGRRRTPSDPP